MITVLGLALAFAPVAGVPTAGTPAPRHVSFPTRDGGTVHALDYGKGERAVVLAHGGRFNKESWEPQARAMARSGFRVLAIDFRGYGQSHGPGDRDPLSALLHHDVLAAAHYLRQTGARTVAAVGGSMGGGAAAQAAEAEPDALDRIVLLGATPRAPLRAMKGPKLFIMSRDDVQGDARVPRLPEFLRQYELASDPKELLILEGSAHAQFIFQTNQGERLMRAILRFLSTPWPGPLKRSCHPRALASLPALARRIPKSIPGLERHAREAPQRSRYSGWLVPETVAARKRRIERTCAVRRGW